MSYRNTDRSNAATGPRADGTLDLQQLRTFLAVHRSGSFTAAAQLLRLSQPTVTTQIRSLEQRLGHLLFERLPRGVAPTAEANDLAAQVAEPLDALEVVAGPGAGDASAPPAPLRVAGPAEVLHELVLPSLAPLVEEGVRLRVRTGPVDDLLEELRGGGHDLVLSPLCPRGRALVADPLADEEFVLVASPSWADRIRRDRLTRQGASSLCGAPLVAYGDDLPILRRYWRHVFGVRLTCGPAVTVPDLRGMMAAAENGAGVTVLPRYLCREALDQGRLVALTEPEKPPVNTMYLVRRPGVSDNPHLDRVHRHLVSAARGW
ncbi:LysR family transcriptional regulator [Nocardiopsis quinghaiensis]|uniref:LysR family transcriptional regulator n=1 Tax=Nocardiopsis quinghaiensis TaxID=464995 RepID=UPI0021DFD476|nr:LysR family transcriptional regulator [Nocardiopsis quinghaiensis]